MRIAVSEKVDWIAPNGRRMTAFVPGEYTVKREVGDSLVARGKAVELDAPNAEDAKAKKGK